jgi:hypothetical protein
MLQTLTHRVALRVAALAILKCNELLKHQSHWMKYTEEAFIVSLFCLRDWVPPLNRNLRTVCCINLEYQADVQPVLSLSFHPLNFYHLFSLHYLNREVDGDSNDLLRTCLMSLTSVSYLRNEKLRQKQIRINSQQNNTSMFISVVNNLQIT